MSRRILIVNPNSSAQCSAWILAAALEHRGPDLSIEVVTALDGPAYIETPRDEVVAASAVIRILEETTNTTEAGFDAFVIACSSDPGLEAARATFGLPVVGIGESALLLARGLGVPYAILTNVADDEPYMWTMARRYALDANLVSVQASGFTVQDFDLRRPGAEDGLFEAGQRAVSAGARSICLGCAAMSGLDQELGRRLDVPVFDGVASAVRLLATYFALKPAVGKSGRSGR
jgi:allantoin racemase